MAFMRSLFAGVSALRNQQTMMDVIGNNIANVNTVGFKSGRATFNELYAETLQGATRPTATSGGSNPMQVGLGMSISSIDTTFSQGILETTGNDTDLALDGDGFFVVNSNGQQMYTRAGNFRMDSESRLTVGGAILQGKMADAAGNIPSGTTLSDIVIDMSLKAPAKATTKVNFAGNLNSGAVAGATTQASIPVYDSLGNPIDLTITFTKTGQNAWDWSASMPDPADATQQVTVGTGTVTFNGEDGTLQTITGSPLSLTPPSGAAPMSIDLNFGTPTATAPGVFSGITQANGSLSVTSTGQDGYTSGELSSISIGTDGVITGSFKNGATQDIAQIMIAQFNNPSGLVRAGKNCYTVSGNSGSAAISEASGATEIRSKSLEQSNVDLADEFTKMITAQRGFQASARIITTSDEFLQEVVNLKR
jgi:flagellar hook protein FlgE